MEKKIGSYSFIIGVIVAVVLGIAASALGTAAPWLTSLLIIAGLVVGFLNISGKETKEFVLMSVSLVIVAFAGNASGTLGGVQVVGPYLQGIFNSIIAFVVPATVVVALKDIWALAKGEET